MLESTYLTRQINRTNRNLLFTNGCILLVLVGFLVLWLWEPRRNHPSPAPRTTTHQSSTVWDSVGSAVGTAALGVVGLVALWNVVQGCRRWSDPSLHPIVRQLSQYGPPELVAAAIETEVKELQARSGRAKRTVITDNWLLSPDFFGLDLVRLDEIFWVYLKVTQHSTNFIPTHKTYSAEIVLRDRLLIVDLDRKKAEAERILDEVVQRRPWVMVGYTPELEQEWRTNTSFLIQAIETRRQRYLNQA